MSLDPAKTGVQFTLHDVLHATFTSGHVDEMIAGDWYSASTHFVIPSVRWSMKNPTTFPLKMEKTTINALP